MRSLIRIIVLVVVAIVSVGRAAPPPASLTMIPPQINYQGRLVTSSNTPYADTTHSIDLSLYPTASGGARVWAERYTVQTRDGFFSVNLGSGGTGLLTTNLPVWQVLWNGTSGGGETNNFFMALTVRTEPNGAPAASPAEATPRQQFLTAPFAYRAHQSVYARKADVNFDAPYGVVTPSITGVSNQVELTGALKVSSTVFANVLNAQGASPQMTLLSGGGPLKLGMASVNFGQSQLVTEASPTIQIGAQSALNGPGSDINLDGRSIDIGTTNFTVNGQSMFIFKFVTAAVNTGSLVTQVPHGISTSMYDVVSVGHYTSSSTPVRGAYVEAGANHGRFAFNTTPTSGTVWMWFLGIRKGLTKLEY